MTVFLIKLVLYFAMLLDHVGAVFGWDGWNLIPSDTTETLRFIGRCVFPVFAFLIVNGWKYTRNKQRYFTNLMLFAAISQIPFTLSFYVKNFEKIKSYESPWYVDTHSIWIYLLLSGLFVTAYWYFALNKKWSASMLIIGIATLLPGITLKIYHVWILVNELNVLYTLALGMLVIYSYEKIILAHNSKWYEYLLLIMTLILALPAIGLHSDYGIMGVLLILGLYIPRNNRLIQALVICAWGILLYGVMYNSWYYALATTLGAMIVLAYNGKKGANIKYLFYVFYPAHTLLLGIINIVLRLS